MRRLSDIIRGDSAQIACDLYRNGSPYDLSSGVHGAWFTVKEHPDDADADAVLSKRSIAAGGSDAQIVFTTNPDSGIAQRMLAKLTAADTAALPNRSRTLWFDFQVATPDGDLNTADRGTITFAGEVTQGRTTTTTTSTTV